MLYTVTNSGLQNGRPNQIGANSIVLSNRTSHTFTVANFTSETTPSYSDPEGDGMSYIKILSLPISGDLNLNGVTVSINDLIYSGDISTGNLAFDSADSDSASEPYFTFDVADVGSNSLSGLSGGLFTFNVGSKQNLPPSSVGDKTLALDYGNTYTFTRANFTSETTPAYADPEGDSASRLKILNLPANGEIRFNGSAVVANQIINFSEIDSGYLIYVPDLVVTTVQSLEFNFSIADVGSETFVES